jgi:hypothetical protein
MGLSTTQRRAQPTSTSGSIHLGVELDLPRSSSLTKLHVVPKPCVPVNGHNSSHIVTANIGMMDIYCPSKLLNRFSDSQWWHHYVHQWFWPSTGVSWRGVRYISLTLLKHLLNTLSNVNVRAPAGTELHSHSPERKGAPPPGTGQGRLSSR